VVWVSVSLSCHLLWFRFLLGLLYSYCTFGFLYLSLP
jgi:hypothetical protein